jgi:hypothetical protein
MHCQYKDKDEGILLAINLRGLRISKIKNNIVEIKLS